MSYLTEIAWSAAWGVQSIETIFIWYYQTTLIPVAIIISNNVNFSFRINK